MEAQEFYGVAVKHGTFIAQKTKNGKTITIGQAHNNMRSAVLDIPKDKRGAYSRWV